MAKHASPQDNSFLISIGRHIGAAVGLVAIVAAAFWGIGQIRADDGGAAADGPVIADPSDPAGDTTDGSATEGETADGDPGATAGDGVTDSTTVDPSDAPSPDVEPTSTAPSPEPSIEPSAAPSPQPSPEPSASPASGDPDASSITVQVLDAVLDDGSAAADDVEQRMTAAGYRVVANNSASKVYEVTTVFYSPGHEAAAQRIADEFGWSRVEPKPDNLSSSVHVHVVVGRDEA